MNIIKVVPRHRITVGLRRALLHRDRGRTKVLWRCARVSGWLLLALAGWVQPARAVILWSDLGATLVHETGRGSDILGAAVKRNDNASDTLYFKFHVDPLSDVSTEEYFAALQLYQGEKERLGIGNSQKAWAYSAFNTTAAGQFNKVFGDTDLRSSRPEPGASAGVFLPYELPRRGIENTVVFKVQFVPGADDHVTVWLNPDLTSGATDDNQPEAITTTFTANCSFNEIRLRHGGGGGGWTFSDMAIATSFNDFVVGNGSQTGSIVPNRRPGTSPLTFRSWQREQGLPQNSIRALAQSPEGYLWIGSDDGVARFDGIRFVTYGMREGLRSGRVRVLLTDSRGALWIGSAGGGLSRWENGRFISFTMGEGLPSDSITALAEDKNGRLWVGSEAGLVAWDVKGLASVSPQRAGKDFTAPIPEFKGRNITAIFNDHQGMIWVAAAGMGIFQFLEGKFVRLRESSVDALLQDTHSLLVDKAGRLWLGAGDDLVLCREGQEWRRYRIPRHLAKPYVTALVEERDGTVWAGSVSEGLLRFQQGKLALFNAANGLSDNRVESLLTDREGNLWIGTGAGLTQARRSKLSVLGQSEGLGYGVVQGLAEVAPGVIWAAKPNDGLFRWDGRKFTRITGSDTSRTYPGVNALLAGPDGACWAGSTTGLLQFVTLTRNTPDAELITLEKRNVLAVASTRNGEIWAGTQNGKLWRGSSGTWTSQTNFSQTHAIIALAQSSEGALWIGTDGGGLYRLENGAFAHWDKHSGLLSDSIRALYCGVDGQVWIGTVGGGLSRWRQGQLATFTTREGLPDNNISQILEDDAERLWLGSNRGIACVSKRELEDLAAAKILALYPQVYGLAEGMPSEECTGGFCPAGLRTKSGLLWFSTLKGIVVADPGPSVTEPPAPTIVIEQVLIDGIPVVDVDQKGGKSVSETGVVSGVRFGTPSGSLTNSPFVTIGPGKHRVEFRYTGLSFSAPERMRFRYRLEGLEGDWVEAGAQRTASYGYVPPGQYRFEVIACNSGGVWNQAPVSLSLAVLPHLWQAGWFIGLAALGLLAFVGGAVRIIEKRRLQRHVARIEQERAVEHERARIAQDLHDDLGSSLARISLLSSLAKADKDLPTQVETHVNKIAQSADETMRALEEIVWAVRPGSDSLQSLVEYIAHFASELFEGNGTHCRLDLPHDLPARPLPPEMRHNIFLVVKEALANAFKHAGAKEVRVQAQTSASSLEIVVQDDGRGFDSGSPAAEGKQHGLGNMQRRAQAMGAKLAIKSDPGKGTMVKLSVRFPIE